MISARHALLGFGLVGIVFASPGRAAEPFRVVAGYTARSFQDVYVEDAKRVFKTSSERLLRKMAPEIDLELRIFAGPEELTAAIKSGQVDLAGFTPNQLVEVSRLVPIDPAFVTETPGGVYEDALLLVRNDSNFKAFRDLKGARLMILEGAEGGHHELWLDTLSLREAGEPMARFFASIGKGRTSSQTLLSCFFSGADACMVPQGGFDLAAEMNPQVGRVLRVLDHSTGVPGAVIAFRPGFDPVKKRRLADVIARAHEDPLGLQVLTLFRQTRIVAFRPEYLEVVEALVREREQRMKAYASGRRRP